MKEISFSQRRMDHVAIMRKDWKLIQKILSGEKRIESRWYKAKYPPWNKIKAGDIIYFKDAGSPVTAKAGVEKVLQFENYSGTGLKEILEKYGAHIAFASSPKEIFTWAKQRRYCILIFLKDPEEVSPFDIDKTGFGNACAWMCVDDIETIIKKRSSAMKKSKRSISTIMAANSR